jgi:HK97 family phage prohead protease
MDAARLPDTVEIRTAAELRVAPGRKLEGYAAVFDQPTRIAGFYEVVRRSSFNAALASDQDVIGCVDHDHGKLLGRRRSGTLRLAVDAKGLFFSLDVPQTHLGVDVLALVERGDISGASFAFRTRKEAWVGKDRRELLDVELIDVCVCQSYPAYAGTAVSARARHLAAVPEPIAALQRRRSLGILL